MIHSSSVMGQRIKMTNLITYLDWLMMFLRDEIDTPNNLGSYFYYV